MLQTKARAVVTRHDYVHIPDGAPRYQLIEGDLIMAPSPGSYHQDIVLNLAILLRSYLTAHPIGRVYIAPLDTYLTELNVYQPDLLFVRKENRHIVEDHGVEGAPDLVVEVLSKSTEKYDLGPKLSIYTRTGVEEFWAIDPRKRTLAVYRLGESATAPAATYRRTQTFTPDMFPGLTLKLADVFASP